MNAISKALDTYFMSSDYIDEKEIEDAYLELARLQRIEEAALKARKILSGKIPTGETLHEVVFRASEILRKGGE